MNTDKNNPCFFVLSVFICVYPWPIMSLPGLEEIALIPRHQESRDSSRPSSRAASTVPERREESRRRRHECLRHVMAQVNFPNYPKSPAGIRSSEFLPGGENGLSHFFRWRELQIPRHRSSEQVPVKSSQRFPNPARLAPTSESSYSTGRNRGASRRRAGRSR